MTAYSYSPKVFDVNSMEDAKRIILTKGKTSTDSRWERETPYLLSLIEKSVPITADSFVLDYGCGIGRMSKVLIERFGCTVLGVDISLGMRTLADEYVCSDLFASCHPMSLLPVSYYDLALSIWVLQHCDEVEKDINRIACSLKEGGILFLVNSHRRYIPTNVPGRWMDDQKDIPSLLGKLFELVERIPLNPFYVSDHTAERSYCSIWRKK